MADPLRQGAGPVPAPEIDAVYARLCARLPDEAARFARALPFHLGLTASDEEGWERFVGLLPNRDLPAFASKASPHPIADDDLNRFRVAHFTGGFWGLTEDRLLDRQVEATPELAAMRRVLHSWWRESLHEAFADPGLVEALTTEAHADLIAAVAEEQAALAQGSMTPLQYRSIVARKLSWISVSARCLLAAHASAERAAAFRALHELLLLSLQLLDDALDADDDRRVHGTSIPVALGLPAGALVRASSLVARHAAGEAHKTGFGTLRAWLAERAAEVAGLGIEGPEEVNRLGAAMLMMSLGISP